ncbi:MAG TPA: hypothetical protein VK386_07925, partial [Acidimicrobiales bacterium]|nr:hypothetical protein [Acidimicrobiales bacterium]
GHGRQGDQPEDQDEPAVAEAHSGEGTHSERNLSIERTSAGRAAQVAYQQRSLMGASADTCRPA